MNRKRDTSSPFGRPPSAFQRFRRKLLPYVETVALWLPSRLVPRLSRRAQRRLARVVGVVMASIPSRSRRIARANLDIVYGDTKTPREKRALLRAAFDHSALVLLDYFWFSRHTAERLTRHCVPADERMERWIVGRFPGLLVTGHFGNWELGGQYIALRGRSMWSVYRPIGTSRTLEPLLKFRRATGQQVIAREGAMMGMMRALRRNSLVALLLDQHTDPSDGGFYLDFFGLPAAFSNAAGHIANRLKIPIAIAGVFYNAAEDRYRLTIIDVISGEEAAALEPKAITTRIVADFERMILDHPEQWLWVYRRWKRWPLGDDPDRFPFYAVVDRSVADHPQ
ncbi:MAG: lysophospholipid acyltransferase family protein [Kiritimatiellia bacterium]|jgi:KDO2-lipid IV(A) lauroyltransferase